MLSVKFSGLDQLVRKLADARSKAIPYAIRDAINDQAFQARSEWQHEMGSAFTLRNRWTVGSIRIEKATGLNVASMQATVGSLAPYMGKQEFGGANEHTSVPMAPAAGQAPGARRTKVVRAGSRLSALNVTREGRAPTPGVARMIAIREARKSGSKTVLLRYGGKQKLFRVMGGKRKAKLRTLYRVGLGGMRVPQTPTLEPAVATVRRHAEGMYLRSVKRQLHRIGLL